MPEPLPTFRYHPDPVSTGAIQSSTEVCESCQHARGYVYAGAIYAEQDITNLCPWCIADGSAAAKFDAQFADAHSLAKSGISRAIIDEVTRRTPGYESWQGESWLSHCDDACEFHGDALEEHVANASAETKQLWMDEYELTEEDWDDVTEGYEPGGDSAMYKFVCRQCGQVLLGWDVS